jgi:type I restriction enzyme, S subunit
MSKLDLIYLKDIAETQTGPFGTQLHEKDYVTEGTPIVTVEHLGEVSFNTENLPLVSDADKERLIKYTLKQGDIVFSRVGSVDRCTYVSEKEDGWMFSGRCLRVRFNEKANAKYVSYYFRQKFFKEMMLNISVGATMPSLNTSLMDNIPLYLPSKNIQTKVAAVLSSLDAKIELNNRINAELEAMAKTLYDYWFVQFDFPDANGRPYKTSGGKMVWSEELKREVPEGWKVQKMADWIDIDKSGDWGKGEAEGNFTKKVVCFRGADINGLNGLAELKPPVRFILEKNANKILRSHDIIIEISGGSPTQSTGRLAFITDATIKRFEHPLICSNFCKPISMRNKKLLYNFVYYWNSLYDNGVFFGYEGKTSGIKNLLLDAFVSTFYTVVPDSAIVNKFYDFMESIQEKKQTTLAENQKLAELRDWLLPMLMNGQVKVGERKDKVYKVSDAESYMMAAEPEVAYKRAKK